MNQKQAYTWAVVILLLGVGVSIQAFATGNIVGFVFGLMLMLASGTMMKEINLKKIRGDKKT